MKKQYISQNTLKRIPFYLDYLKKCQRKGIINLSSTTIANSLELNPVQVRKDLAIISKLGGKPKVGYEIAELLRDIETFLGLNNNNKSILVGVGSLGTALLKYDGFTEYGLEIIASFDNDENKINTFIGNKKVYPLSELKSFLKNNDVHIGIIAVPRLEAQKIADLLVECGIQAIWNFAPTKLTVPNSIIVQNENMASSLSVLSRHLNEKRK